MVKEEPECDTESGEMEKPGPSMITRMVIKEELVLDEGSPGSLLMAKVVIKKEFVSDEEDNVPPTQLVQAEVSAKLGEVPVDLSQNVRAENTSCASEENSSCRPQRENELCSSRNESITASLRNESTSGTPRDENTFRNPEDERACLIAKEDLSTSTADVEVPLVALEPVVTITEGAVPSDNIKFYTAEEVAQKLSTGELILLQKERSRSKVWEKFASVYDNVKQRYVGYVQCRNCSTLLSMKNGGTFHLSRHVCRSNGTRFGEITSDLKRQLMDDLIWSCANMCARDLLPFSLVSGKGFRAVAQELINLGSMFGKVNISEICPPEISITRHITNTAHNIRQSVMPEICRAVRDGVCAMELWTGRLSGMRHLSVTAQYITDDWVVRRQMLFVSQFENNTNLKQEILSRLTQLGVVNTNNLMFVTNQHVVNQSPKDFVSVNLTQIMCAANNIDALVGITSFGKDHFRTSCPTFCKCITAAHNIIQFLRVTGLIRRLEPLPGQPIRTWHPLLDIVESVNCNYQLIVQLLTEVNSLTYLKDWNNGLVNEIMTFLQKFKEVTTELQNNAYPTLHLVLIYHYELMAHCNQHLTDHPDTVAIKTYAKSYLLSKEPVIQHYLATFLCPNTRLLKQLDAEYKRTVHEEVKRLCSAVNGAPRTTSPVPTPAKRSRFGAWNQHEEDHGKTVDELSLYIATGRRESEESSDLLAWWKEKAATFPRLSQVARRVLCIPATSLAYDNIVSSSDYAFLNKDNLVSELFSDVLCVHSKIIADECTQVLIEDCSKGSTSQTL